MLQLKHIMIVSIPPYTGHRYLLFINLMTMPKAMGYELTHYYQDTRHHLEIILVLLPYSFNLISLKVHPNRDSRMSQQQNV